MARVAQYFGIDISDGAILGIVGGGGAARSTAYTWQQLGGRVRVFGGNRELTDYKWIETMQDGEKSCDIFINFDDDTIPSDVNVTGYIMKSKYHPIHGEHSDRIAKVTNGAIDGRWLLAAQHLESWSQLWAPQCADMLPPLDLLISMLITAESVLASYS